MNTDGNTAAIERMMADREEYDERREAEQELQDLRDEVDALAAKLAEVEAERRKWQANHDTWMSMAKRSNAKLAEVELATDSAELLEALDAARIVLAEYEPHPLPVLAKVLAALAKARAAQ